MKTRKRYDIAERNRDRIKKEIRGFLKIDPFKSEKRLDLIGKIIEECFIYEFRNEDVKKICEIFISSRDKIPKFPKDQSRIEKKIVRTHHLCKEMMDWTEYRFFLMGGAMGETMTFYGNNHSEVWGKVSSYCRYKLGGAVRAVICISVNGKDVGTLKNLEAMFSPISEEDKKNGVRSVRASDLSPEYKKWK